MFSVTINETKRFRKKLGSFDMSHEGNLSQVPSHSDTVSLSSSQCDGFVGFNYSDICNTMRGNTIPPSEYYDTKSAGKWLYIML